MQIFSTYKVKQIHRASPKGEQHMLLLVTVFRYIGSLVVVLSECVDYKIF